MGFIRWMGRMFLWLVLWPVGLWRSLVNSRKKGEKRAAKRVEKMLQERDRKS